MYETLHSMHISKMELVKHTSEYDFANQGNHSASYIAWTASMKSSYITSNNKTPTMSSCSSSGPQPPEVSLSHLSAFVRRNLW